MLMNFDLYCAARAFPIATKKEFSWFMRTNVAVNIFSEVNLDSFSGWNVFRLNIHGSLGSRGIWRFARDSINHHNRPNETCHGDTEQIAFQRKAFTASDEGLVRQGTFRAINNSDSFEPFSLGARLKMNLMIFRVKYFLNEKHYPWCWIRNLNLSNGEAGDLDCVGGR